MAAVIVHIDFGAQENEIWHCFHIFPIFCYERIGLDAMKLRSLNVEFWASVSTLLLHFH